MKNKEIYLNLVILFLSSLLFRTPISAQILSAPLAPRNSSEQATIDVYKEANKAVVNISVKTIAQDFLYPVYQEGSGSGVIIDKSKALIATNFHVIKGADQIQATLANGKSYDVELVGEDPDNELALIKLVDPPDDLTELPLGDSGSLEVGQSVLAIGNPFGLTRTLTQGIISSLGRSIRSDRGTLIGDVIQTDAAINPGNSGGPLIDMAGRVIGLNTAILSKSGDYAGIGFAIPANYIKKAIPQLIKYGKIRRPKIGVIFSDTEAGPVILSVQPNSPADKAGLQGAQKVVRQGPFIRYFIDVSSADFIKEINGQEVKNKDDATTAIMKAEPSAMIEISAQRGSRGPKKKYEIKPILE